MEQVAQKPAAPIVPGKKPKITPKVNKIKKDPPLTARDNNFYVPINSVVLSAKDDWNRTANEIPEDEAGLAQSIKEVGQLAPIIVKDNEDGNWRLVDGRRRFTAMQKLEKKEVQVTITKSDNAQELSEKALILNIQRKDNNPMEIALQFQKWIKKYELTQKEIADKVGWSPMRVSLHCNLNKLSSEVQEAVLAGQVSASQAKELGKIKEGTAQLNLLKKAITGVSSVELGKMVEGYLSKHEDKRSSKPRVRNRPADEDLEAKKDYASVPLIFIEEKPMRKKLTYYDKKYKNAKDPLKEQYFSGILYGLELAGGITQES